MMNFDDQIGEWEHSGVLLGTLWRPVGTRGGVGWMRGPCACPRWGTRTRWNLTAPSPRRPVGTRGGVGWMRGPCACPARTTIRVAALILARAFRPPPGQAQGPHLSHQPPPVPTGREPTFSVLPSFGW